MALIKRFQIHQKGEITLKKPIDTSETPVVDIPTQDQKEENTPQNSLDIDQNLLEEKYVSEGEQKAKEILNQAKEDARSIRDKAYREGLETAKHDAGQKIKEALATLNQAVIERKKIIKEAESEILRISIRAAEQIMRSEVSLHRDVCLNIVSDAINRVSDREQVIIRVNREDAEYIKRYKERLSGIVDGVKSLSILEDSQIEPGGCIIETNLGYVDARISTKLQALEDALQKASQEEEDKG